MRIIRLRYLSAGLLGLYAKVEYNGQTLNRAVPFVVDTGAQRTLIVPYWKNIIRRELGSLKAEYAAEGITTLGGEMNLNLVPGIKIIVNCCDGKEVSLNNGNFACYWRLNLCNILSWRRSLRLHYNLLGSDILSSWTLYHNPKSQIRFLVDNGGFIDQWIHKEPQLQAYFTGKKPPTIDQSDIEWLD